MKRVLFLLLFIGSGVMSGCAIPQQLEMIEREQRRIRSDNVNIVSESTSIRRDIDSVRASLADTRANLQQMQQDIGALKEKVDEVRYQMDRQIGKSSREGDLKVRELEGRLAKMEDALKARDEEVKSLRDALLRLATAPAKQPKPARASEEKTEATREKVSGESDPARKDYEEAMRVLDRKDYRAAIARFREFLKKNPQSDYADNAQYWIGESYYALREFDQAILEFDAVRRRYPKGEKVPGALLKMGFAFAELGDRVDARLILRELIDQFPKSDEAGKAKQKLKSLES